MQTETLLLAPPPAWFKNKKQENQIQKEYTTLFPAYRRIVIILPDNVKITILYMFLSLLPLQQAKETCTAF